MSPKNPRHRLQECTDLWPVAKRTSIGQVNLTFSEKKQRQHFEQLIHLPNLHFWGCMLTFRDINGYNISYQGVQGSGLFHLLRGHIQPILII